ncbi:MAG: GDSL-type esterase/lipase family protein [Planctomycetales bacterium]
MRAQRWVGFMCRDAGRGGFAYAAEPGKYTSVRIALIGDSTVSTYEKPPADRPELTGWGQVFGEFFRKRVEVRNFASSGRSSKSFLAEGRWQPVLDCKPDYVFIQFGHNDMPGKGDRSTDPDKDYQGNLRKYINETRAAKGKPVLVTSVARRQFKDGKAVTTLTPYVNAMKKVAREEQVPLIDLHAESFALFDRLGDQGSTDFSPIPEDRSHFSRKGAWVMARFVANALPRAVPELIPWLDETALFMPEMEVAEFPGTIRLQLPPVIYGVVGLETNLYFDNVVLVVNPENYVFDVQCPKGRQQRERWTFAPKAEDVGEHALQLEVRNEKHELIARGKTVVKIASADSGAGKEISLLAIGDSLTHASVWPERVQKLCAGEKNLKVKLIGSHEPGRVPGVRHEGYGGWTAERFGTYFTGKARTGDYKERGSPFLYSGADGKPVLDFTAYCKDVNGGKFPEVVTIFLGPNDVYGLNESALEEGVRKILKHFDALVEMVHKVAPETVVGIMLPVPPAGTQDAFGANYGNNQTRWQYKRNSHRLVEKLIERYGGRESEKISLIPTVVSLDCVHNYGAETAPWNADSEEKGSRLNNGVHPAVSGYHQIGDAVSAWLKGSFK